MPVTFQIYNFIHQTHVTILIDSGNTHSFIQPWIAKFLSLALHDTSLLWVMVGNGSILECQQHCADIPLILQGHSFTVTLHLLPISDADIVLGIDWFQQLGPVVTDYTMLSMNFHHLGSPVELCVDVQTEPLQSFAKQFKRMIQLDLHHPYFIWPFNPLPLTTLNLTHHTPSPKYNSSLPSIPPSSLSLHPFPHPV